MKRDRNSKEPWKENLEHSGHSPDACAGGLMDAYPCQNSSKCSLDACSLLQ